VQLPGCDCPPFPAAALGWWTNFVDLGLGGISTSIADSSSSSSWNFFGLVASSSNSGSFSLAFAFFAAGIRGRDVFLVGAAFAALVGLGFDAAASACLLDFSFAQSFFITMILFDGLGGGM
jgi:hypothetical protein